VGAVAVGEVAVGGAFVDVVLALELEVLLPLEASRNCCMPTDMGVFEFPHALDIVWYTDDTSFASARPKHWATLRIKSPPLLQRHLFSSP
jgi:hypothetical protein